ncbi:hypothetical protein H0H93_001347 [Arthromyces matolae]|nr:hypothetical protein H0H93_001347 [Arthromyces matolae]
MNPKAAYVTLLTKSSYLAGTLVLDYGLRAVHSKYPLVVMVTPSLPLEAREVLTQRGILMREVESLHPRENSHTLASHDERFADTWTKLRGFELTEYDRIVLLDCDMIIMKNMDELMDLELPKDHIAAVHSQYFARIPENCAHTAVKSPQTLPPPYGPTSPRPYQQLNSGTVVLNPSKNLAEGIVQFLSTSDKIAEFSFPDQDLLTEFFKGKWIPLHWYYNALRTLRYIHPNLWKDEEVRCLHYILPDKPWQSRTLPADSEAQLGEMNRWWWSQFDLLGKDLQSNNPSGWKLVLSSVDYIKIPV